MKDLHTENLKTLMKKLEKTEIKGTKYLILGCEGDLAATSVIPLIARVDSADLAG